MGIKKEYELTYDGKKMEEDIVAETDSAPLQKVKEFYGGGDDTWMNKIIFGDNLPALKHLLKKKREGELQNPDGSNGVKLVYIDPPFSTERDFEGSQGEEAYRDKVAGSEFIEFLRKRLVLLRELLTDDGTLWVHLDDRMNSQIRLILDEVMGTNHFVNEIIWHYPDNFQGNVNRYANNHNSIYCYSKEPGRKLDIFEVELDEPVKRDKRVWDKEKGKVVAARDDEGNIIYEEHTHKKADDVWQIGQSSVSKSRSRENLGYPTQKPEELLQRIIYSGTDEGDIVLDCFAGSGTTGAVAEKLGRRWIQIDSSKLAIYTQQKRMLNLKKEIGAKGDQLQSGSFGVYNSGIYNDDDLTEKMKSDEYREFALELFQAEEKKHDLKGLEMDGLKDNRPVMVFSEDYVLTKEFIEELHENIGEALEDRMYVIAPQNRIRFNQDYIRHDDKRYVILRVPYSIIEEIREKDLSAIKQPNSEDDINQTIEQVGFDFIHPPKVETSYYTAGGSNKQTKLEDKGDLQDDFIIQIEEFEPVQISPDPVEFDNTLEEALAMVMIDRDYNGEYFIMDDYFWGEELIENDFKIKLEDRDFGNEIMVIYLDVLGNEKREVINLNRFEN